MLACPISVVPPLCKLSTINIHRRKTLPFPSSNSLSLIIPTKKRTCHSLLLCSSSSSRSLSFPPPFSFRPEELSLPEEELSLPAKALLDNGNQQYEDVNEDEDEDEKEEKLPRLWNFMRKALKLFSPSISVEPPLDAVVKLLCTQADPDFSSPWQKEQGCYTSTGFIIGKRRVLTCAHSLDHQTEVKLKKHNSDAMYTATVLAIAPECDLAMLTVSDDEFWKGVKPVEFGDLPGPKDKLTIAGYPYGRDVMSVTRARVSRMGMVSYSPWETKLLALQVDVHLKRGRSGAPAFDERGKCVGMGFQSTSNKIADFVPSQIIKHFIHDYDKNGAYTGFLSLGIRWQEMKSADLRMFMKMGHDQEGVLITEVKPNYPESDVLKRCDIILSIDGIKIGNDGTVPFTPGRRIDFSYLLAQKYQGDEVAIKVLRDSKVHEFNIKLTTHKQFKPTNIVGSPVPYYIIADFVFTTLSPPYLKSVYGYWFYQFLPEEVRSQALYEERVVICKVLNGGISSGYDEEGILYAQVLTLNGKPVQGMKSLVNTIESCEEEFLEFTLDNQKADIGIADEE